MKIVAVTTRSPYPLHEGRALRTFNLLRHVGKRHDLFLATFCQSAEELAGLDYLREFCAEVHAVPLYVEHARRQLAQDVTRNLFESIPLHATKYRRPEMVSKLADWLRLIKPEVIHLDMLHLGELLPVMKGFPVVLTEHNVESVILDRRATIERNRIKRAYLHHQHVRLLSYEERICRAVDQVVTVSDLDADLLRKLCPEGCYTTVPNGVDSDYFVSQGADQQPNTLVYVGGLTWFPNLDAIRYFCTDILPHVRAAIPDVKLKVVGRVPGGSVLREFAQYPEVQFLGLVDDVRPIIDEAAVYIVPLRVGGGTRLKILDALSMGKGLVCTSIGCEGLEVEHGRHLLVADEPREFAAQVVNLLSNADRARSLGQNGRELVCRRYNWQALGQVLESVYQRARTSSPSGKRTGIA